MLSSPVLRCIAASVRMLFSCSSHLSPNPNPSLHRTMKAATEASRTPHLSLFSNPMVPNSNSSSQAFPQSITLSKCFSVTPASPVVASEDSEVQSRDSLVVVSFYKFADFHDHADLRKPLKALCEELVILSVFNFTKKCYIYLFWNFCSLGYCSMCPLVYEESGLNQTRKW